MKIFKIYTQAEITSMAKALFLRERAKKRLDGWFIIKGIQRDCDSLFAGQPAGLKAALTLKEVCTRLPLDIDENAVFAGTQSDSFARSYALINPQFRTETFAGYCDPTAVFDDIEPGNGITTEEIEILREYGKSTPYAVALNEAYRSVEPYTSEVAFFVEQVTGHLIPDMRSFLRDGVVAAIESLDGKINSEEDLNKKRYFLAMKAALEAVLILAERYAALAYELAKRASGPSRDRFLLIGETLEQVPGRGARNLYEAIQSFLLLWQVMCLEQSPNPFAFSVGNADRIFEPYRAMEDAEVENAAALFKHFLTFFNVGDRSWAISQNIIVGGKDADGRDLTNYTLFSLLEAYYDMNLPQPILSVKLHKNTPKAVYAALGKFFFTPGCLTPSLFNDDAMFEVLSASGVKTPHLPDYSIAGCQEPLIMGRDNGNTTNSWLNLAKILELCLNGGRSLITGKAIGDEENTADATEMMSTLRQRFYCAVEHYAAIMADAANRCTAALSLLPVPFLSCVMGGLETGIDVRDVTRQGTEYNGSGCLIHGLSVVSDSFVAIDCLLRDRPHDADRLLAALRTDFENDTELLKYLKACPKYGNNDAVADSEAAEVAGRVADIVRAQKNNLGNPFRSDFSTPSTHLLYGYWVGATPDGRHARDMLNYGIDPLYGDAASGMGFRTLSAFKLPFIKMNGGYASHYGVDPGMFHGETFEDKGLEFRDRVIAPLFFNEMNPNISPFYLYVNVTTPETLRKVLAEPEKYAPGGIYIMRIHGTFVNFLDLSPAIQADIINRLDLKSTKLD